MNFSKNKKYNWSLLFLILLIGVTFYYLFRNNEIEQLLGTMNNADPVYLAMGLVFMFLFVASQAIGIKVLMQPLSYRLSFFQCLRYAFVGFYYCNITPSSIGGQPAQVYYMKRDNVEIGASSFGILSVTVAYQFGIVLLCLSAFLFRHELILQNVGVVGYLALFGTFVNFCMISAFALTLFHNTFLEKIVSFVIRLLAKIRLVKNTGEAIRKIDLQIAQYRQGAAVMKKNPRVTLIALFAVLIQIVSRLAVSFAVYKAFHLSGHDFIDIIALQAFLFLGVEYLPLPGAVGAAETGFLAINRVIFGADKVVPAMLLSRGISFYAFLIISGCVTIGIHLFIKRRSVQTDQQQKE